MTFNLAVVENNIIGLIICLIIYFNISPDKKKVKADEKLFLLLIFSISLILVFEILRTFVQGTPELMPRKIHISLVLIYFILTPVPLLVWFLYTYLYIHKSVRRLRKIIPFAVIPAVVTIGLSFLSVYNKAVFFVDENNLYNRGNLYWINAVLYYSYVVATYVLIIGNRKNLDKKNFYTLLMFGILAAVAGGLQIVNVNASCLWLSASLSSLIVYLNIQNVEIYEDYLTGLYNRRHLDMYLKKCIREEEQNLSILLIMLDIDFFKQINDTYGHLEGDEALKQTANLLTESFRADDFISRYAGDEFVVIAKLKDKSRKKEIVQRLKKKFEDFNNSNILPYNISISLGYDIYEAESKMDADGFIRHVDKLMYKDKLAHRSSQGIFKNQE